MLTTHPSDETILRNLEHAVLRLADAVNGEPPISAALRRFAFALPGSRAATSAAPPNPPPIGIPIREVLYEALDAGAVDARRFDWLMLAEQRARRRSTQ